MKRGQGMQRGVQRALGLLASSTPESIKCNCSTEHETRYVQFGFDAIGRTVEICPTGRCWRGGRVVTENSARLEMVRVEQLIGSTRQERERTTAERYRERVYGRRICLGENCAREFLPHAANQKFCSTACAGDARRTYRAIGGLA